MIFADRSGLHRAQVGAFENGRMNITLASLHLVAQTLGVRIVYIGEGDPVSDRLTAHFREKDFWSTAAFFTSRDENLHKAHLQYLEARLICLAREADRCHLMNGNSPLEPSLSEIDQADTKSFLGEL